MEITKDTRLVEVLEKYPWLPDELVKMDGRLSIIKSPIGKMMIKKMTVQDAVDKTGLTLEELLKKLDELIARHR